MNIDQRDLSQNTGNLLPQMVPLKDTQDDIDLVKASQQGDQSAFALLVQRHQQHIFALSVHMLQDAEEASNATRELFLAAWQGLSAFRGDALFSSWLYRIAYHCCVRVLDLRKREYLVQERMWAEQVCSDRGKEQQAMEDIERHDQQVLMQKKLEHLPSRYRMVLRLRYLQDRTYEEMADILTMPIGTIKTHLFRAKSLLKECLIATSS